MTDSEQHIERLEFKLATLATYMDELADWAESNPDALGVRPIPVYGVPHRTHADAWRAQALGIRRLLRPRLEEESRSSAVSLGAEVA